MPFVTQLSSLAVTQTTSKQCTYICMYVTGMLPYKEALLAEVDGPYTYVATTSPSDVTA